MYYQGGKRRIGAKIAEIVVSNKPQRIVEPFIGGGGFLIRLLESGYDGEIVTGDFDPDITAMMKALRYGWLPPRTLISEQDWERVMKGSDWETTALRGFTAFASMLMGRKNSVKYKYAVTGDDRRPNGLTRWSEAYAQAEKLSRLMLSTDASITIVGGDYAGYAEFLTPDTVVYCDPPYAGTSGYGNAFSSERFWTTMADWERGCNKVFVSEYSAPKTWSCVWDKQVADNLRNLGANVRRANGDSSSIGSKMERLFSWQRPNSLLM